MDMLLIIVLSLLFGRFHLTCSETKLSHSHVCDRRVNMSPVILLFLLVGYMNTASCKSRQREINFFGPFHPYPQPVNLPLLPQYEIDVPEQEGKLFGHSGVAATRYETVSNRIKGFY